MLQDNTWVRTSPPSSAEVENSENRVQSRSLFRWFNCLGEVNRKNHKFRSTSFIIRDEINIALNGDNVKSGKSYGVIQLFDRNFVGGPLLLCEPECSVLFNLARQQFLILQSTSTLLALPSRTVNSTRTKDVTNKKLRKHICQLFSYVRSYLARILADREFHWMLEDLIPSITKYMSNLRLLLQRITNLPDYILNNCAVPQGNECPQAAYHLFHAHLDLRWYHLTITYLLLRSRNLSPQLDSEDFTETTGAGVVDGAAFEKVILLLVSDLLLLAIHRFDKLTSQQLDILGRSPFNCTCVKELWLMLELYLDSLHERGQAAKPFWGYVNTVLETLLSNTNLPNGRPTTCAELQLPRCYTCSNGPLFCIWLLSHGARLYGYTSAGSYEGPGHEGVKTNFPMLQTALKRIVDGGVKEQDLRTAFRLVHPLLVEWWELQSESIMLLWEFYQRRLNNAFFIPGATPDSIAIMRKTGFGLLQQVRSRLEPGHLDDKAEDSFSLFLKLLGQNLKRSLATHQERYWQQMRGRVYSKFPPIKMVGLSELGLYHFVSLFLMLASIVSLQEVSKKMQTFLNLLPPDLDIARRLVVWKGNIALIHIYVEKGLDISEVSEPLLQEVTRQSLSKNTLDARSLMRVFVEGVQDIMDASHSLQLSEYKLIGDWMSFYLSSCSVGDTCRLLNTVVSTVQLLHGNGLQHPEMRERLSKHVYPYVRVQFLSPAAQPAFQIADLASGFTRLALDAGDDSFVRLFTYFATVDGANPKLTCRFLSHLLPEESVMEALESRMEDYQCVIIQAWIRCLLLSTDGEVNHLTLVVLRLPQISELGLDPEDPLFSLLRLLGRRFESLTTITDKAAFRTRCNAYLGQVGKTAVVVMKNPTISELVNRMYTCCAVLVVHCSSIIYVKSKPNCLLPQLVNQLLLPPAIYDPGTKLHPNQEVAMRRTLHHFVQGMASLNPGSDPFIARTLRSLIEQYLPRLVPRRGTDTGTLTGFLNSVDETHPLLRCCCEGDDWRRVARIVLETVVAKYVTCRGRIPHAQAPAALSFIHDLLELQSENTELVSLTLSCCMEKVLEMVMLAEDLSSVRKQALGVVEDVLKNPVLDSKPEINNRFLETLELLCKRHLAFTTAPLFKLYQHLVKLCPSVVIQNLPQLRVEIKCVEHRRGVGYDPVLRRGLEKIESSLDLNCDIKQNLNNIY